MYCNFNPSLQTDGLLSQLHNEYPLSWHLRRISLQEEAIWKNIFSAGLLAMVAFVKFGKMMHEF
jgi:hypothetical protein